MSGVGEVWIAPREPDAASPYERLELEMLFVELAASSADDAWARVAGALEGLGLATTADPSDARAWRRGEVLPDPRDPARFGVEALAPDGAARDPSSAWTRAHAVATSLPGSRAEPTFRGDVPEDDVADRPRAARESFVTEAPPPGDVRWHLRENGALAAHDALRAEGVEPGAGVTIGHPDTGYTEHVEIFGAGRGVDAARGLNLVELGQSAVDPQREGPLLQPRHGTGTASVIVSCDRVTVPRDDDDGGGDGGEVDLLGVAPHARVVPIRVTNSVVMLGWQRQLAEAIERAVDLGCEVISMSVGGIGGARLERAVEYAERKGVIVVAAAGNVVQFVVAPAAYPTVVACAATGPDGRPWWSSSKGAAVDITAPGHLVWVAGWDGARAVARNSSGTSFAAASVAGAAALWRSRWRDELAAVPRERVPALFRAALRASARPSELLPHGWFGAGMLDCARLLDPAFRPRAASPETVATDATRPSMARAMLASLVDERPRRDGAPAAAALARAESAATPADALDAAEIAELAFHLTLDPAARRAWRARSSGVREAAGASIVPARASARLRRALRGADAPVDVRPPRSGDGAVARGADPLATPAPPDEGRARDRGAAATATVRVVVDVVVRVRVEPPRRR